MNVEAVETWLEGYIKAWGSNNPQEIGALFADDALYYTAPFREPWRGREAIVAGWIDIHDEPDNYTFRHEVLATEDNLGVVRGWTTYLNPPAEYSNLWLIRFDDQGRATEFTEWWMAHS